jgi:outer membrane receptor protein involved in Fe transport
LTPAIGVAVDGERCADLAGCIPYEVFTYQGVTEEAAAQLLGTAIATGKTSTRVINGFVTGDTGWNIGSADSIMVAGGFEHRIEKYQRVSDTIFQQGSLAGQGGPTPGIDGSYNVTEFFLEGNVPLLTNVTGAQALNLDLAYRYSDYSTSGGNSTYRFGIDWQPIDMLRVRMGYNRAVRAPNVAELFAVQSLGLWSGVDPCATATPVYTAAQCANTGVSAAQYGNVSASPAGQYNGLFGGNPTLDPEVADTYTFGVVIDPTDNMTISVDYWRIDIDDTINNVGPTTILEQCGLYGQLCEQINRSATGNLWQGTAGFVVDTTINLGNNLWEGIDLAYNWTVDGAGGTWTTNIIGTYMMSKETTPLPADKNSTYDCVGVISPRCYPSPEWRHTASVSYDSNEWWSLTARWRYFQGVDYDGSTDTIAQDEMSKNQNYFDLSAVFRFMGSHDIVVGVNNVFDKEPPMVGGTLSGPWGNANTVAGFYDTLGRYLYANATFRF